MTYHDLNLPHQIDLIKKSKHFPRQSRSWALWSKTNNIDEDLFKLFLNSGVYAVYAEKYLQPEQIDEVDIAQYLSQSNA